MGEPHQGVTYGRAARKRGAVLIGAVSLAVVGTSPATASGIGDRVTEWPVATAIGAALVFGVLAIVFAALARSSRREVEAAEMLIKPAPDANEFRAASATAEDDAAPAAETVEATAPSTVKKSRKAARAKKPPGRPAVVSDADPLYTPETCRDFAQGLSDEVLQRSQRLFQPLGQIGRIDSVQLAELLGTQPASLGGLLTTPISRRADALGLPLPYVIDRVPGSRRRVWRDHAGIASRMSVAIRKELDARGNGAIALPAALDQAPAGGSSPGREVAIRSGVSPY
ncbi:MAG: hypothetical protein OEM67_01445 [Thermoleophilia bacterium]|nr:hypothetical protein [Thermoleophilia bacterium]MDH3725344.1 hypothetical protein [Thermoleophilia bacterium]